MATRTFHTPPTVTPLSWWRVDTASGSDTPAAIFTPTGSSPLIGALRSDANGVLSAASFRGPDGVTVLYLKRLTREVAGVVVAGTTIALDTGIADPPGAPASPGGITPADLTTALAPYAPLADPALTGAATLDGQPILTTATAAGAAAGLAIVLGGI